MVRIALVFIAFTFGLPLWAADKKRIMEIYRLVGVISLDRGHKPGAGVAVLKKRGKRKRSYTIKTGQRLPKNPAWVLKSVARNQVVLERRGIEAVVGYAFNSTSDDDLVEPAKPSVEEAEEEGEEKKMEKGSLDEFDHLIEEYRRKLKSTDPRRKTAELEVSGQSDEAETNQVPAEVVDLRDDYRSGAFDEDDDEQDVQEEEPTYEENVQEDDEF